MESHSPSGTCRANAATGMNLLPVSANGHTVKWIIDSGATHHITYCENLLSDCRKLLESSSNKVQVPTRSKIHVEHVGNAVILENCRLKNVLHVPDFRFNLLSVSKLTKDLKCMVSFYPDLCVMQALSTGEVVGIGKEEEGLYILRHDAIPTIGAVLKNNCIEDHRLWHLRLGHPSLKVMQHLPMLQNKVDEAVQEECMVCPLAKQCRLKFPSSVTQTSKMFELVHLDVWGPHRDPTYDRKYYF